MIQSTPIPVPTAPLRWRASGGVATERGFAPMLGAALLGGGRNGLADTRQVSIPPAAA
jgi:hypothetical protein